jgi:hypothetical protein
MADILASDILPLSRVIISVPDCFYPCVHIEGSFFLRRYIPGVTHAFQIVPTTRKR